MADPAEIIDRLDAAADRAETSSSKMERFVEGPAGEIINTESGPLPTIAGWLETNQEAIGDFPALTVRVDAVEQDQEDLGTAGEATGAAMIQYLPAGGGVAPSTLQAWMRRGSVEIDDWLRVYGSGPYTHAQTFAAMTAAFDYARTNNKNLHLPGEYEIGENSYPWRQSIVSGLLDCNNMIIYGDGPNSICRTNSTGGADAYQLNGVKNLHIRNIAIETLVAPGGNVGSNGISITGGFDNLTFEWIWMDKLATVDAYIGLPQNHLDGGKGLSVQCDAATQEVGSIWARNIFVKGSAQGLGIEFGLANFLSKKVSIDVEMVAENCFVAATLGAGAATGTIPAGTQSGVKVRMIAINCQKDLIMARVHGADVKVTPVTTKTKAQRRLNPQGGTWFAADTLVEAAQITYAKNSPISIIGNKGECDRKVTMGGASVGVSGLNGATEDCDIHLDIAGTASTADIVEVDVSGSTTRRCRIYMSPQTAAAFPASMSLAANLNRLELGTSMRLPSPTSVGSMGFNLTSSGTFQSGAVALFSSQIVCLQGKSASAPRELVAGLADQAGNVVIAVGNSGRIVLHGLPTYADNAAAIAGGLSADDVYRTSTGQLMVRF